jgi:hypothetical protein
MYRYQLDRLPERQIGRPTANVVEIRHKARLVVHLRDFLVKQVGDIYAHDATFSEPGKSTLYVVWTVS